MRPNRARQKGSQGGCPREDIVVPKQQTVYLDGKVYVCRGGNIVRTK